MKPKEIKGITYNPYKKELEEHIVQDKYILLTIREFIRTIDSQPILTAFISISSIVVIISCLVLFVYAIYSF